MNLEECEKNPFGLYEIKEGDTAISICAEHGILLRELMRANGLEHRPGRGGIVKIPKPEGEVYVVSAGETIKSICEKFNMREDEFCRRNGCDYIYPTQRVLVRFGAK